MRDRRQLVPLTEPDERWGMSPVRRRKLQAGAAEIIADEKLFRDLRQALALTQERITRAPKELAKARGVPCQRFVRKTSKHALNGRA